MIRVTPDLLADINAQAVAAYPRECCGLLVGCLGHDGTVTINRVVASANTASGDTFDRFEIDPQVRFDLMREVADGTDEIVGHYHSHPDHPPEPSQTDLDMAFEPDFVWLITAVTQAGPKRTQAWRLNRDTREVQSLGLDIA